MFVNIFFLQGRRELARNSRARSHQEDRMRLLREEFFAEVVELLAGTPPYPSSADMGDRLEIRGLRSLRSQICSR